ncbi:hypothetical protein U1Q18_031293 [Sarracenia purpurea var. burkii]
MSSAGETDSESCKRHEDVSGSSDSSEWVRVRKRRNSKKGKRQDPILDSRVSRNEGKENEFPAPGGFRPSDQSYRLARPSSPQRSRAPAQVGSQLSRPAPADYAFCKETNIETFAQGSCPVYKESMKADIVVNQPDSEDECQEVIVADSGTVADEFDSPVVRISPGKSSLKSPPNKKASSSKRKKKRSNSKSFYA